jgi:hypothetical protein
MRAGPYATRGRLGRAKSRIWRALLGKNVRALCTVSYVAGTSPVAGRYVDSMTNGDERGHDRSHHNVQAELPALERQVSGCVDVSASPPL